jgi:hypothetical protein
MAIERFGIPAVLQRRPLLFAQHKVLA